MGRASACSLTSASGRPGVRRRVDTVQADKDLSAVEDVRLFW